MRSKVTVLILPKPGILDPQGKAIEENLPAIGYDGVESVRVGKVIEMVVKGDDAAQIESRVSRMCDALLANPVIEDYEIELANPEAD